MKSTIGLLSDCVPLFGYHKRSYLVVFSIFGSLALFALALYTVGNGDHGDSPTATTAVMSTFLFSLVNLQVAAVDLLTEGKYAELMVANPQTGPDMISFVQGVYAVGGIFGSILVAPLVSVVPLWVTFVLCAILSFHVIFVATNLFPEHRDHLVPPRSLVAINIDKLRAHDRVVKLSILLTVLSIVLAIVSFVAPQNELLASMMASVVLVACSVIWMSSSSSSSWSSSSSSSSVTILRNVMLFLFLNNAMYVPISGALDYFFTADNQCVPDGPNFSTAFYVSTANALTQFAYLLGAILFQLCFSRGSFRTVIIITNLVKSFSSLADIILASRLNRRVNIPDWALFIFGDAVFYHVAYRFELIPLIVLTSKVCPPGFEASVYALLVSFQNYGGGLGQSIGFALMSGLNIQTVYPCDFSNLTALVIIARLVLPLLSIPLVFYLIPTAQLTDDIVQAPTWPIIRGANIEQPHRSRSRPESSDTSSDGTPNEITPLQSY